MLIAAIKFETKRKNKTFSEFKSKRINTIIANIILNTEKIEVCHFSLEFLKIE